KDIQVELNKRKPTLDRISTTRKEEDRVELLSGVFNGHTTGAPVSMLVWNKDIRSEVYESFLMKPRPGHADYPARIKYGGFNDFRGGGRFSARTTVGFVMAGAVAKKLLKLIGVEVLAHVVEIGGVGLKRQPTIGEIRKKAYARITRCVDSETSKRMEKTILDAKARKDSVGGIIECMAINPPVGLGEPVFDPLDADIAQFLFCIPAVKGVEFGIGFKASRLKGSQNNDSYSIKKGKVVTLTNNAGGILGGLSSGMPIVVRAAFKPTSSIPTEQKTVNLKTMTKTGLRITGRYDACVVPRAVPIVESAVAIVLADHVLRSGVIASRGHRKWTPQ
ncbi:MAG: chorismate synthase, partial [Candidatus Bathyarchaeota archaeon]